MHMLTSLGPQLSSDSLNLGYRLAFFTLPLVGVQALQHFSRDLLVVAKVTPVVRVAIYSFMLIWIFVFGVTSNEFIYFQF